MLIRRSRCLRAKSAAARPHRSVLPTSRLTLTGAWARVGLNQAGNRNIDCNSGSRNPPQRENPAGLQFLNLMRSRGLSQRINLRFQLFIHRPRPSKTFITFCCRLHLYGRHSSLLVTPNSATKVWSSQMARGAMNLLEEVARTLSKITVSLGSRQRAASSALIGPGKFFGRSLCATSRTE
jgi:hypothetical protein